MLYKCKSLNSISVMQNKKAREKKILDGDANLQKQYKNNNKPKM